MQRFSIVLPHFALLAPSRYDLSIPKDERRRQQRHKRVEIEVRIAILFRRWRKTRNMTIHFSLLMFTSRRTMAGYRQKFRLDLRQMVGRC